MNPGRRRTAWRVGNRAGFRSYLGRLARISLALAAFSTIMSVVAIGVMASTYQGRLERDWSRIPRPGADRITGYWDWDFENADGRWVDIIFLAPTSPDFPIPPGLTSLPAPGVVVVSPGLRGSIAGQEISERYGTLSSETIGPAGLTSEDERIAYVGVPASSLTETATPVADQFGIGHPSVFQEGQLGGALRQMRITEAVPSVLVFLIIPALVLLLVSVRLRGPARDRRALILRLQGAGRRDIVMMAGGELVPPLAIGAAAAAVLTLALCALDIRVPGVDYPLQSVDLRSHAPWMLLSFVAGVVLLGSVTWMSAVRRRTAVGTRPRVASARFGIGHAIALPIVCFVIAWGIPKLASGGYPYTLLLSMVAFIPMALTLPGFMGFVLQMIAMASIRIGRRFSSIGAISGGRQLASVPGGARMGAASMVLVIVLACALQIWGTVLTEQQRDALQMTSRYGTTILSLRADLQQVPADTIKVALGADADVIRVDFGGGYDAAGVVMITGSCPALTALRLSCPPVNADGPPQVPHEQRADLITQGMAATRIIPHHGDPLSNAEPGRDGSFSTNVISTSGKDLSIRALNGQLAKSGTFPAPATDTIGGGWLRAAKDQADVLGWGRAFFAVTLSLLAAALAVVLVADAGRYGTTIAVLTPWGLGLSSLATNTFVRVLLPLLAAVVTGVAVGITVSVPALTPPLSGFLPATFIGVSVLAPTAATLAFTALGTYLIRRETSSWTPGKIESE